MYIRSPFAGEYHMDGLKFLNKSRRSEADHGVCTFINLNCDLHDYEAKSLNNSQ